MNKPRNNIMHKQYLPTSISIAVSVILMRYLRKIVIPQFSTLRKSCSSPLLCLKKDNGAVPDGTTQ